MYFSRIQFRPDVQKTSQLQQVLAANSYGIHQMLWVLFPDEKKRTFLFREEIAKEQIRGRNGIKGESVFYLVSAQKPADDTPIFQVESKRYKPALVEGQKLAFKLRANPVVARKTPGKKHSVRHDVVMDAQRSLFVKICNHFNVVLGSDVKKSALKKHILHHWRAAKDDSVVGVLREILKNNERFAELYDRKMSFEQLLDSAVKAKSDFALATWFVEKGHRNGFELVREENRNGLEQLMFQAAGYRWHALPKKGKKAGFSSVDFEGELKVTDSELFQKALFSGIGPAKAFGCGLLMVRRL